MIREVYYQGSFYLPLVEAAFDSWADLERRAGRKLLDTTGALMIGSPDSYVYGGCLRTAREQGLAHEDLGPGDVAGRFPQFRLAPDMRAVFDPRAGVLALDECLRAVLARCVAAGCELRADGDVLGWRVGQDGATIRTATAEHRARRLVLAAGAWTARLVPELRLPLEVERTVQYWFRPATPDGPRPFEPPNCPAWVWEYGPRETWYGVPATELGVKLGMHVEADRVTDPDKIRRAVDAGETELMRGVLRRFMPTIDGPLGAASVCMYTNTPDERFIIDRHPNHDEVVMFAGGSGHAFKFALVLGEILADLATGAVPSIDVSPFALSRFGPTSVRGRSRLSPP